MGPATFLFVFLLQGNALPASRPALPEGGLLVQGRCVTEDGAPIAGCAVQVTGHQATGYPLHWVLLDWRDPDPVVTGADGTFRIEHRLHSGRGPSDGYPHRIHLRVRGAGRPPVFAHQLLSLLREQPRWDLGDVVRPRGMQPPLRVVDDKGRPQNGVRVSASTSVATPRAEARHVPALLVTRNGTSGRDGRVEWDDPLQEGRWTLSTQGFRILGEPAILDVQVLAAADPTLRDLVVASLPDDMVLRGRILDEAQNPMAGLRVAARAAEDRGEGKHVSTDRDGFFLIALARAPAGGEVELRLAKNNRYDGWASLGIHKCGPGDVEIVVPRGRTTTVQVAAKADGRAVEELSVLCQPTDPGSGTAAAVRWSGRARKGLVSVPGLAEGAWRILVYPHDGELVPSEWIEFEVTKDGGPSLRVELPMPTTRTVRVLTTSGKPVAGSEVSLFYPSGNADLRDPHVRFVPLSATWSKGNEERRPLPVRAAVGRTDDQGLVRLSAPRWKGPVTLLLGGPGHVRSVQDLEAWLPGDQILVMRVPDSATATGRISPIETIRALDASTPEEEKDFGEYGTRSNEWGRSLEDLKRGRRPGLALHSGKAGDSIWMERVFPIDEDGRFALRDIPPGKWQIVLVVWRRNGNQVSRELQPEPLAEIDLTAGRSTALDLLVPADLVGTKR